MSIDQTYPDGEYFTDIIALFFDTPFKNTCRPVFILFSEINFQGQRKTIFFFHR